MEKQLLEGSGDLFCKGRRNKENGDLLNRDAELLQGIGKLKMELE